MAQIDQVDQVTEVTNNFIKGTVVSWNPVGIWTIDLGEYNGQDCPICSSKLTLKCMACMGLKNIDTQKCQPALGMCGHAFHYHCIDRSLKQCDTCPMCSTKFKYKTQNIDYDAKNKRNLRVPQK